MKCGVANKARNLKKHKKAKAKSALSKKAFLAEKAAALAAGGDVEMGATDAAAGTSETAKAPEGSNKELRAHGIKLKKQLKLKTKELKTQRLKLTKLPKGDAKQAKRNITTKLQALRKESLDVRAATGGDKKASKGETASPAAAQESSAMAE